MVERCQSVPLVPRATRATKSAVCAPCMGYVRGVLVGMEGSREEERRSAVRVPGSVRSILVMRLSALQASVLQLVCYSLSGTVFARTRSHYIHIPITLLVQ